MVYRVIDGDFDFDSGELERMEHDYKLNTARRIYTIGAAIVRMELENVKAENKKNAH